MSWTLLYKPCTRKASPRCEYVCVLADSLIERGTGCRNHAWTIALKNENVHAHVVKMHYKPFSGNADTCVAFHTLERFSWSETVAVAGDSADWCRRSCPGSNSLSFSSISLNGAFLRISELPTRPNRIVVDDTIAVHVSSGSPGFTRQR